MFNIGPLELMVILVVALLVVGPSKLPDVGRSLGRAIREFRRAQEEVQRTLRLSLDDDSEPPARPMRSASNASAPSSDSEEDVEAVVAAEEGEPSGQRTEADDLAKALGRGLAELRRAKEELQNSFRVDLGDDRGNGSRAG
jgi:sec-independent protein translocase protein TatA